MKALNAVLATAALLVAAPTLQAETAVERGEKRLARMLGDRVAGPPVQCFEFKAATRVIEIEGFAVVYSQADVIYVGRVLNRIDPRDRIMGGVNRQEVCTSNGFYTVSRRTFVRTGIADIREFVPYRRD